MIEGLKANLARRGYIKIGGLGEERKSKTGEKYALPEKWDHFKVTTLDRDSAGRLIVDQEIMRHYGEKPKEINIIFFSNRVEDVYEDFFAYYTGKTCVCKGNGQVAIWDKRVGGDPKGLNILEDKGNGKVKVACCLNKEHGEDCPYISKDDNGREVKCKPNAVLRCLIEEAQSVGAVYEFRTTSWNTVRALRGSFGLLERVTGGHIIAGLPLKLRISPKPMQVEGKNRTVYIVHFEYPGSIKDLRDISLQLQKQALRYEKELVALSSGFEDSPEEIAEVVREFYPESGSAGGLVKEEKAEEGAEKSGTNVSIPLSTAVSPEQGVEATPAEAPSRSVPQVSGLLANEGQLKMIRKRKEMKEIPDAEFASMLNGYRVSALEQLPASQVNDLLGRIGKWTSGATAVTPPPVAETQTEGAPPVEGQEKAEEAQGEEEVSESMDDEIPFGKQETDTSAFLNVF